MCRSRCLLVASTVVVPRPADRHVDRDRHVRSDVTEHDRTARRRLVWLLLTRGDLGAETLRSDGMPALRPDQPGSARSASASSNRASASSSRSPNNSRS
jgi:hypothetical protein